MNRFSFPRIALILGVIVAVVILQSGALDPHSERSLPLLTLLIAAEFGFFVTAIGAVLGVRTLLKQGYSPVLLVVTLGCGVLGLGLLYLGFSMWPGVHFSD
jgi:hypothetical protein